MRLQEVGRPEEESGEVEFVRDVPDGFASSEELSVSMALRFGGGESIDAGCAGEDVEEGWVGSEGAAEPDRGELREGEDRGGLKEKKKREFSARKKIDGRQRDEIHEDSTLLPKERGRRRRGRRNSPSLSSAKPP